DGRGHGLNRFDAVLAVEAQLIVLKRFGGGVIARLPAGWNGLRPLRGIRGDEELVIEERTAVSRVKKIIAKCVLLGELTLRQIGRVDVAENEARIVAPSHELVEIAELRLEHAVVDLQFV